MSKLRAPRVDDKFVQKALDDIYDILNQLMDRIKEEPAKAGDKEGSMKLIKEADGTYNIGIKFSDGYVVSTTGTFEVK